MRSFRARLAAVVMAAIGCLSIGSSAVRAEVGGLHLNLTPYAGFAAWDGETNVQDHFLYGGRVGIGFGRTFGIEGTWGQTKSQTHEGFGAQGYATNLFPLTPSQDIKASHLAADLQINLVPGGAVNPYIQGGWSQVKFQPEDSSAAGYEIKRTGFNVAAGLKLAFSPKVALRLEARDVIYKWGDENIANGASDKTQSSFFYTSGLQLTLGGSSKCIDVDMDGVCDKVDTCPNTTKGCTVDAKGCPTDSDNDGICDGLDQCPNTPAGCKIDEKGCPIDSDGDGVCDGIDTCANTMQGCRVDEKGCPIDSDGDGVCDGLDLCPNTPSGARVDKDGCPIEITKQETEMLDKGVITVRNIYFDTAKWDIKPESNKALQDLCTIFKQWPTLQIEIGGHADSRGAEDYNQTLT